MGTFNRCREGVQTCEPKPARAAAGRQVSAVVDANHRLLTAWKRSGQRQTRRAPHRDVRRFPTEPWMASRKIPERMTDVADVVEEAFFFGSVSFGAFQKK
ncbi:hypothetical protein ACYX7E_17095 [Luteimonas sp. RIT-PG2_3]